MQSTIVLNVMKSFIHFLGESITADIVDKFFAISKCIINLRCSDFFFEGKDLDENEKQVRMCNSCYQKCWKYLAKHDESYI